MSTDRRSFLTKLGAGVTVAGVGRVELASAQTASSSFTPAKHAQDDWMDRIPGKHRMVIDTTTPASFGAALAYANNFLTASAEYGLKDSDNAVIIVARHFATTFAYNDAMWAKYGKFLPPFAALDDPKTKQRAAINLFAASGYQELPNMGTTITEVTGKGIHFAVCNLATTFFAGMLAQASGGKQPDVYKELAANLIGNSHLAAAGIVAVNRAQEHGFTLATAT
jgi:intracellular sulfur oxidation DsrE/DsrF family protein